MDNERFDVGYIGKQGEYLQVVDELLRFLLTALDLKGEDGNASLREILLVQHMIRMSRLRRMVDLRHMRILCEIVHDLQGVLHMAFHTKRERLDALQEQEGIER